MNNQTFPTKSNLINIKKSLSLSATGYELLDKKRLILVRELMELVEKFEQLRGSVERTFQNAYGALQRANIELGIITSIAEAVPLDDGIKIRYKSVMGAEIPVVTYIETPPLPHYGLYETSSYLDYAYKCFHEVKLLVVVLAELENSIFRLSEAIRKIQRRANALKNVIIPGMEKNIKFITEYLEEKEREDFSRLKVIKERHAAEKL